MRITVRVQDYAQVPHGTLAGAKQEATRILEETGIVVAWLDCGGSVEAFTADPGCAKPFTPTDLLLRILPRTMAERIPLSDSTFGFALQSTDSRLAFAAGVFYDRVEELAEKLGFSRAQILGYHRARDWTPAAENHSPFTHRYYARAAEPGGSTSSPRFYTGAGKSPPRRGERALQASGSPPGY